MMQTRLPLEGIRILDFCVAGAGPFSMMMLADMGAEIIHVDNIYHPDTNTRGAVSLAAASMQTTIGLNYPNRQAGTRPYERYAMHNFERRNAKSVTFALHNPRMMELFHQLVDQSDAITCNNSALTLDKMGLGYEVISARNPRIVMLQMPGFGNTPGPYRDYRGYGANMEAIAGHTWLRGYPDLDPTSTTSVVYCDAVSGATAAFLLIAALRRRTRTGKGQHIDVAQTEVMIHQLAQAVMDYSINRRVQGPMGNRNPLSVQGVYRCQGEDKWLAISIGEDEEWRAMCAIIGRPELADDPRFFDAVSRHHHHDTIDEMLAAWAKDQKHDEVFHVLQRAGIMAGPVLSHVEAIHDPHLRARGFFEEVTYPFTGPIVDGRETPGTHEYPGPLFDMSTTPLSIRSAAPTLGQHNEYVYKDLLGLSDAEYEQLIEEKLIGTTYVQGDP